MRAVGFMNLICTHFLSKTFLLMTHGLTKILCKSLYNKLLHRGGKPS